MISVFNVFFILSEFLSIPQPAEQRGGGSRRLP